MIYKEDIIKFIKNVWQNIDFTLTIDSIINNNDRTFDLEICDIGYLEIGSMIIIGGNNYKIIEYIIGGIRIKGEEDITVNSFIPYQNYFFQGTPIALNSELADINNVSLKTPMLYFYEIIKENFFEDNDNAIERESNLRLFFLTQANFQDWKTTDFHTNAIQPMRRFMEIFIEKLKNTKRVNEIVDYTIINHNKFGVFVDNKGIEKGIFSEEFSGCELNINLQLRKKLICDC